MEEEIEHEGGPPSRLRHIKKRALKNKALAVSFNEKDLNDYVSGFHKRKKKRRKEAVKNQEEALRRKRIDARKKRKLERALIYGETQQASGENNEEGGEEEGEEEEEEEEEGEAAASVGETKIYSNGEVKVTVTTSEIFREDETLTSRTTKMAEPRSVKALGTGGKGKTIPVIKNKPSKKVARRRSGPKQLSKKDKHKGKTKTNNRSR